MKIFKMIASAFAAQLRYFTEDKNEIANENLSIMQIAGAAGTLVSCIFFIIAPIIIPSWHITREYIFIIPILLFTFLFSFFYSRREKQPNPLVVEIVCALIYILMLADFIALSVFPYPDTPQIFISLCFILMPALMIQRPSVLLTIMLTAEVIFVELAKHYKSAFSVENDIFNTIASMFFAGIIMTITNRLRFRNYASRMTLERLSRTDALTGLLNKAAFEERAAALLDKANGTQTFTLLILDLDDFKAVNDSYGHPFGDSLLNIVGELLLEGFRRSDLVGRIGGDEFAVLMCGEVDERLIAEKYEQLKHKMDKIIIDNIPTHSTCSVGAVISVKEYKSYTELFRMADEILYQVKREGKSALEIKTTSSKQTAHFM